MCSSVSSPKSVPPTFFKHDPPVDDEASVFRSLIEAADGNKVDGLKVNVILSAPQESVYGHDASQRIVNIT